MSLLGEIGYALVRSGRRAIGPVIPDVVIEELARDEVVVTQHAVEKGAPIADHAFRRPVEFEMRCGFSNSSAGFVGYTDIIYRQLVALQRKRQPFTLYTGKRVYRDMLLTGLAVVTDKHSEHSLLVQARLQEVILTSVRRTGTGTNTAKAGSGAPPGTEPATDRGTVAGSPVGGQSLAGALNPGSFNTEGGTLGPGGFGFGSFGEGFDGMSGISPAGPPEITLPEQEVSPSTPGGSGSGSGHNIWEFG